MKIIGYHYCPSFIMTLLKILLFQTLFISSTVGADNTIITPSKYFSLKDAKKYIEFVFTYLEVLNDPPSEETGQPGWKDYIEERQTKLIDSTLYEITNGKLKYDKFNERFNRSIEVYRDKIKKNLLTLSHNSDCDPKVHFKRSQSYLVDPDNQIESIYSDLDAWQNMVLSDIEKKICNFALGLVCSPSKVGPPKCTCPDGTNWRPEGCFLTAGSKCKYRNINTRRISSSSSKMMYLKDTEWFAKRVLLYPIFPPTCGPGLLCDNLDLEYNPGENKCWCLDKITLPECKDEKTWKETVTLDQKVENLYLYPGERCTFDKEINETIYKLRTDSNPEPLKQMLVDMKKQICNFKEHEICNKVNSKCTKSCPYVGQIPNENNKCRYAYGEKCKHNVEELSESTFELNECVDNSLCKLVKDRSENIGNPKMIPVCICNQTYESENMPVKKYYYGFDCRIKSKSLWLQRFIPFKSGLKHSNFTNAEILLDANLKEIEQLMTLNYNDACDPALDEQIMNIVNYFGNLEIINLTASAIVQDLENTRTNLKGIPTHLCDYRHFLHCNKTILKCDWIHEGIIMNETNAELKWTNGQLCDETIPENIPKIFYSKYEDEDNERIGCISNSFCTLNFSQTPQNLTKRCRCARGWSGEACNVKGTLEEYNSNEKSKLKELIKFRNDHSISSYQSLCDFDIENQFSKSHLNSNATDLYKLYSNLEPMIESIEPLKAKKSLELCSVKEFLICKEANMDPMSKTEIIWHICDCMQGFERIELDGKIGCYISDGEFCGESWEKNSFLSVEKVPRCASEKCTQDSQNNYTCEKDQTYKYFVNNGLISKAFPFLCGLSLLLSLSSAFFISHYNLYNLCIK